MPNDPDVKEGLSVTAPESPQIDGSGVPQPTATEPVGWMVTRDTDYDSREYFHTEAEAMSNASLGVVNTHVRPLFLSVAAFQSDPCSRFVRTTPDLKVNLTSMPQLDVDYATAKETTSAAQPDEYNPYDHEPDCTCQRIDVDREDASGCELHGIGSEWIRACRAFDAANDPDAATGTADDQIDPAVIQGIVDVFMPLRQPQPDALRERARKVLSIRTLTAAQMENCIPAVAAEFRAIAEECAEIADQVGPGAGHYIASAIRAKYAATEGK